MTAFLHPNDIRGLFSAAMSDMYRTEVPQYGTLIQLVRDVNARVLENDPILRDRLTNADDLDRLDVERHGAIRLGTADELSTIRRMFAVMGMHPVGYYDLSVADLPVHSTAFRPIKAAALKRNPFRVFTSLLRLELIEDRALAETAAQILSRRQIATDRALELLEQAEQAGGLTKTEAAEFVTEAVQTFRWHARATVDAATYEALHSAHRLIADVVSFPGPHINHLTPRTLDIDAVQAEMPSRGIAPKAVIEGPPRRDADILLRQTSFKALNEAILFPSDKGDIAGQHTARFGEIEQRGVALTPKGRALYDQTLNKVRQQASVGAAGEGASDYMASLSAAFEVFPADHATLREQDLAFYSYRAEGGPLTEKFDSVQGLIVAGHLIADPQVYEDFLPVSAAGIFQSNLGTDAQSTYSDQANRDTFEQALGTTVYDEMRLYERVQSDSLSRALIQLGQAHLLNE